MDKAFHQLIERLGSELSSSDVSRVGKAVAELEGLAAQAESNSRTMWDEWRSAGGPIGAERLEVLTRRAVIRNLLGDARRLQKMTAGSLQLRGTNIRIMRPAGHAPGDNRLALDSVTAEMSFRDIEESVVNALVEEDGGYYYWPVATYRDRVVYEANERGDNVSEGQTYWRRSYVVNDDDSVTLGEKTEVKREVSFVEARKTGGGKVRLVRKEHP